MLLVHVRVRRKYIVFPSINQSQRNWSLNLVCTITLCGVVVTVGVAVVSLRSGNVGSDQSRFVHQRYGEVKARQHPYSFLLRQYCMPHAQPNGTTKKKKKMMANTIPMMATPLRPVSVLELGSSPAGGTSTVLLLSAELISKQSQPLGNNLVWLLLCL